MSLSKQKLFDRLLNSSHCRYERPRRPSGHAAAEPRADVLFAMLRDGTFFESHTVSQAA
jgi:hypothetical protein